MDTKFYQYSLLKYRPSLLLDEQVNIGLLLVFNEDRRVEFIYPKHLSRLNALYPQTDLSIIRAHLKGFENKAKNLTDKPIYVNGLLNSLIETDFLPLDSNSLFFTEFKVGTYLNADAIIAHYRTQFFAAYDDNDVEEKQYDAYLVHKFEKALKQKSKEKAHLFHKDFTVGKGQVTFKFDYGWQNGNTNALKFLNFNLKDGDAIVDKSSKWYGKTALLNEEGTAEGVCFDFHVGRPKDRSLYSNYDTALEVLEKIPAKKRIFEEEKQEEYLEQALVEIKTLI
jgi:Protein of unknown function (DUF3037)